MTCQDTSNSCYLHPYITVIYTEVIEGKHSVDYKEHELPLIKNSGYILGRPVKVAVGNYPKIDLPELIEDGGKGFLLSRLQCTLHCDNITPYDETLVWRICDGDMFDLTKKGRSAGGTFVNRDKLLGAKVLDDGDIITFRSSSVKVIFVDPRKGGVQLDRDATATGE